MDKNRVNIKYTTNILHFQVEGRKQNLPSPKQHKRTGQILRLVLFSRTGNRNF